jgi:NAD(P)-dependent dehydrogenase (short-subunit alcohol dehydrogenase family)
MKPSSDRSRKQEANMQGRVVLVTGAARGIGKEVAGQLAERGATVLVSARDADHARAAAKDLRPVGDVRALEVDLDVTDDASVRAAVQAVEDDPGGLDVLVNNAAAYVDWTETASTADLAAAHQVLEVNLFGSWRLSNALLPLLRRSGHPRIVNVSSGAGSHGDNHFGLTKRGGTAASYGISKAALNALTSTLAAELAGTPILVNAVCPGLTATWPGAEAMCAQPVAVGAASVLWAATLPDDGPTGQLRRDGRTLPW